MKKSKLDKRLDWIRKHKHPEGMTHWKECWEYNEHEYCAYELKIKRLEEGK